MKAPLTKESHSTETNPSDPRIETPNVPDCWDELASQDEEVAPSTITEDVDSQIVLGPGGQWGMEKSEPKKLVLDTSVTKVASWSLPSVGQQSWTYSEITHHGRRKQKLNHKKKRKEEM